MIYFAGWYIIGFFSYFWAMHLDQPLEPYTWGMLLVAILVALLGPIVTLVPLIIWAANWADSHKEFLGRPIFRK